MQAEPTARSETPWWVQGWLDLLESYRFKKRLERARNYARSGNVQSILFDGATVKARVQGTDPDPYRVKLFLAPFEDEAWDGVVETMAAQARWVAQLLAGEMPENINLAFGQNGLSLFPFKLDEVKSKCSCPDPQNPCKHVGAVYYLLADRFADDPFLLFQLRGRTRAELIPKLREARAKLLSQLNPEETPDLPEGMTLEVIDPDEAGGLVARPLDLANFWRYDEPLEPGLVAIAPSPEAETPLDWLGDIPLPADPTANPAAAAAANAAVMAYLREVYRTASQQAIVEAMT